ncbi:acyl carrier protein [Candidatus Pacearchaeota archaeon]|jgi:acyl carrier protein|nr:acyl carrier protein [Candidatus Pacearchaeota archaeon]
MSKFVWYHEQLEKAQNEVNQWPSGIRKEAGLDKELLSNQKKSTCTKKEDVISEKKMDELIIKEKVNSIITGVLKSYSHKEIKDEDYLVEDLWADSLDLVNFIIDAEEEFNIKISDKEAERIETVQDLINLVKEKINGK